jgi:hypothetical protein
MLVSEEHLMKMHKNQRLLTTLSPPDIPCGATNQGTPHVACGVDAFTVTCHGTTLSYVGLQPLENKALSRGIIGKSTHILTEIMIRKSQVLYL